MGLQSVFISGTGYKAFGSNVAALKRRAQTAKLQLLVYAKSGTPTLEDYETPDDLDTEYLHPIDRAFRAGILSAAPSASGLQFSLARRVVGPELLRSVKVGQPLPASFGPLSRRDLKYLSRFNGLDAATQSEMCQLKGATLRCSWPEGQVTKDGEPDGPSRRARKAFGRNYAVYAELRGADGKICRAVSMAVSFSEEGKPFTNMMNALLDPGQGPLVKALGMEENRKEIECDAAS